MTMSIIDWGILIVVIVSISMVAYSTKKYTRSVADFLAANRCAGKYLLGVADGVAGLGAISIVAMFEMYYKTGFSGIWWGSIMLPVGTILAMTGFIQYRFRETRVLTMAQFFEVRYSRKFRLFAGILCSISGIVNFGIFPAVGGRFFQYFMGLPNYFVTFLGLKVDLVYAVIMLVLLAIALTFTFLGGQIAVIVTDFMQGIFCNIALVIIGVYLLFFHFDWSQIMEAAATAPANASLINPMNTGGTENFNSWYFFIQAFAICFTFMAWQGNQGYYCAAKTPHDARMGRIFGSFRTIIQTVPLVLLPLCAYTLMHHVDFTESAAAVNQVLEGLGNDKLQGQLVVTVAASQLLPVGLVGLFAAVMFAAFVSTHDTYLHSWGSILIQDVILPIRQFIRKDNVPLDQAKHMKLLRYSIAGVAVFIFMFSLLFNQQQDILMFFALTGTIFLGWAGSVIIGGLYWKHGNTAGAWATSVMGFVLAIIGWYMTYFWKDFYAIFGFMIPETLLPWDFTGERCPISAQVLFFWTMILTGGVYALVSLITGKGTLFNLERMLHRGKYRIKGEHLEGEAPATGWRVFKTTREFTFVDKIAFLGSYVYIAVIFVTFIIGTIYALNYPLEDLSWGQFWWYYCLIMLLVSAATTIWLFIGGVKEMKILFQTLKTMKRDVDDDGTVVGHQNLSDLHEADESMTDKSTQQ